MFLKCLVRISCEKYQLKTLKLVTQKGLDTEDLIPSSVL